MDSSSSGIKVNIGYSANLVCSYCHSEILVSFFKAILKFQLFLKWTVRILVSSSSGY